MRQPHRLVSMAATVLILAAAVSATWPVDPASPLVLGEPLGIGRAHAVVATTDESTWVSWIDGSCFPTYFVQRVDAQGNLLAAGGLALATQEDDCIELAARLDGCPDGSVVGSGIGNDPLLTPVHRVAPDGSESWAPEVVAADGYGSIAQLRVLPGGDTLVAGQTGWVIMVGRYAADGQPVWDAPAMFTSTTGPNLRIFALVSDGADGAYVLWDSPGAYTNRIFALRIAADGTLAWPGAIRAVDIPPGSSRHTDPVAMADGTTGLVLAWTEGHESGTTPAPLHVQRVLADSTLMFEMGGRRVSTAVTRQFDPIVRQREPGGDLFIAWRDGLFSAQELRVQRMTLAGERMWGDTGVPVTTMASDASKFAMDWLDGETLGLAVTDDPDDPDSAWVRLHRVDTLGTIATDPWPVSGAVPAYSVRTARLEDALAVVWQRAMDGNHVELVAQRIDADGTLGRPAITGDVNADGVVNFEDLLDVLAAWGPCAPPCPADVDGDGVVDFADLLAVLANWS